MKTINIRLLRPFLSILLLTLIFSCNKKPDTIGLDLVDDNKANLGYDTTLSIYAYSEFEDSVISKETTVNLLGSMQTATFGRTDASFYTHLRLSNLYPDFGNNPQPDSIVLNLVYSGYYGNINTMQSVSVHEIGEPIYRDADSIYYSNDSILYLDPVLGSLSFKPNPTDSVIFNSDTVSAQLRIPLNNSLAQRFLDLDSSDYETSTDFLNVFYGLYVKPEPVTMTGDGAILYFDLLNDRSNVTLYYHNATEDSLSYVYVINENCERIGHYVHNYAASSDPDFVDDVLNNNPDSTTIGNEKLFLQGLGGVRTIVKFPELLNWANSAYIVVNEAKLVITAQDQTELYDPPDALILFKFNDEGKIAFTDDQSVLSDDYFGGDYNKDKQTYTFRISLYIQRLLNGQPDNGLVLFPNAKSIRANGLTFYGTDQTQPNSLKLKLIYTLAD